MQLYNIDKMLEDLFDEMDKYAEEHEGIVDQSYVELLDMLNMAKDEKILNIAKYMKGLDVEIKAFQEEIKKLQARKSAIDNKYDYLHNYICNHADKGKKIQDSTTVVSWRKSEQVVVVDDVDGLPEIFVRTKTVKEPDKQLIKESFKMGNEVPGAKIVENMNLQIK